MLGRPIPTTVRVAALSMLLALLSNLALLGFIHVRTHDESMGGLRQRVEEETQALTHVYRLGGQEALRAAIRDALSARDPQLVISLLNGPNRQIIGNVTTLPPSAARDHFEFQIVKLRFRHHAAPIEAGVVIRPLGNGDWLIVGRNLNERLSLERTLERSLLLALAMSVLLGMICGLVLASYVGRRVDEIAHVADRVGSGDLTRRAPISGAGDAFDQLSSRINLMLDRIVGLMEEIRLLTNSLAHDLRSPVSRLRARIERAMTVSDEAQREAALGGVMQEADALMRILSTVVDIGRSEAMAGRKQFAWLDPVELLTELADMYEPVADEAGVSLTLDAANVPPLFGHRQLLAQAISNLLDNAFKYGGRGGAIRLFAHGGEEVRIGVADSGPGIAPADEAEARRRFGRLDSSRSTPGAGLGLALVEAVAHLHGGRLVLEGNNPGLRAVILIPLRSPLDSPAPGA